MTSGTKVECEQTGDKHNEEKHLDLKETNTKRPRCLGITSKEVRNKDKGVKRTGVTDMEIQNALK